MTNVKLHSHLKPLSHIMYEKIFSVSQSVDIAAKKDEKKECPDCEMLISKKKLMEAYERGAQRH